VEGKFVRTTVIWVAAVAVGAVLAAVLVTKLVVWLREI